MTTFYSFCILYAFFFGFGVGTCYLIPVTCAWQYFPNKKGLVTGIIVGGFGFGSFIFSFISTAIVNPHNLKPDAHVGEIKIFTDPDVLNRVPTMLRYLVAAWACMVLVSIYLIKGNPHQWEGIKEKSHENDLKLRLLENKDRLDVRENDDRMRIKRFLKDRPNYAVFTFKQAFFSTNTLLLWLMITTSASYGMFMAHVYKSFGIKHFNDDFFMTTVGSFGAVMNGGSRSIWSTCQDKFTFKRMFGILLAFQIALSSTLVTIANLGEDVYFGKWLYLLWIEQASSALAVISQCFQLSLVNSMEL
jgi:hypothetical protein